jgi:hypothetical protein
MNISWKNEVLKWHITQKITSSALTDEMIVVNVAIPATGSVRYGPFCDMAAYQPVNINTLYHSSGKEMD